MWNFHGIIFMWIQRYGKIFKFVLVYLCKEKEEVCKEICKEKGEHFHFVFK